MDPYSSDLEFFDFGSASDEEIKEIQNILKGPGSNGCVELPWETSVKENCLENIPETEVTEENEPPISPKSNKNFGTVVGPALQFVAAQTPLSPQVAPLPPPGVEAFVTMPTTVGPYPNAPYFVSRTLPYLRAYPHMGVPLFACPMPTAGETSPYGQFVPVVPAPDNKFMGQLDSEQTAKAQRGATEKQFHRRKKKLPNSEYTSALEPDGTDAYHRETVLSNEVVPPSSIVSSERPTSMPIVPLPPSSFAVAGGALPLHGYPPSLHTLPYTQMSGPQAPSPAMYYVPVFNHPYGGYISSPSAAPMVLPVSLRPEVEVNELVEGDKCPKDAGDSPSAEEGPCIDGSAQLNCEGLPIEEESHDSVPPVEVAKSSGSEKEFMDSNSCSDPASKSVSSSPDCLPKAAEDCVESQLPTEEAKEALQDSSRCWADLFKKPCSNDVNGIDEHRHSSTFKKDIANGKFSVPASESFH